MELFAAPDETIAGASAAIRSGRRSCREFIDNHLDWIDTIEPEVRAWVVIDHGGARRQADRLDAELRAGRPAGSLHGIPIGVKDIIDVEGLPTACGIPGWSGRVAAGDAAAVADLRRRGAVIVGKTVSTPYAWIDPPPTRNPFGYDRTPGGSSSGSAAAVACSMCLGAIGTQTGGSITRPAAFCGVCGFKPTYGSRSVDGILPLSPSLDHPGPIARTVGDLSLLAGLRPEGRSGPPTIGRLLGFFDERAEPSMLAAMGQAMVSLAGAGARVVGSPPPGRFAEFASHHYAIMSAEASAYHRRGRERDPDRFPPRIGRLIDDGLGVTESDLAAGRSFREELRGEILAMLAEVDALATPAATGPAPDPSTTGDPAFNSPWSLTGLPTVSFPIGLSPEGLPLGVQLVGRPGPEGEAALFGVALWCESAIRRAAGSPELPPVPTP